MNKLILFSVILGLLVSPCFADALYEKYNVGDDGYASIYGSTWRGQTFTVGNTSNGVSHNITKINLKLYRYGDPGLINVSIKATDGDGKPIGNDLSIGSTNGDTLTTDSNGEWREITMSNYRLQNGIKYAVIVKAVSGNIFNNLRWRRDESSPTYLGGEYVYSTDSGSSWSLSDTEDWMFEIYGNYSSPVFSVSLNSPANQTITSDETHDFNFTVSGNEVIYNCSLYLNNSFYGNNVSVSNNTSTIITSSSIPDGFYKWYVNCTASLVTNKSKTREITIDLTNPVYSERSISSRQVGTNIEHRLKWNDLNLSGGGYIFSFCNGTWDGSNCNYNGDQVCYQETANNSSVDDGNCTLNYTGVYSFTGKWVNNQSVIDGSWGSYGEGNDSDSILYINYTKPQQAIGAEWQVKDHGTTINLSITNSCWNYNNNIISLKVQASHNHWTKWSCRNKTGWETLRWYHSDSWAYSIIYDDVYEEAIYWNLNGWIDDAYVQFNSSHCNEDYSECWSNVTKLITSTENVNVSWKVWVNDSVSNENQSENFVYLTINDTIHPAITTQQISTNYYNGTVNLSDINLVTDKKSLNVNVSATDANLQSVWARLYNSITDYIMSLVSGTIYSVDIDLSKGSYNISSFANDTAGNENNTANTSVTVSDFNLSTYLTLSSDYYWDTYSEITANSTINKVKYINDTGTGVSDKINVLGYYIDGTECEVNDIAQSVAGGVCEYTHTINKGDNWDDLELYDSNYGNGTPVTITETSVEVANDSGNEVKKRNVTISYYLPNGSSAPAGTFTNSTSLNICTDSDVDVANSEFLRYYNGTEFVDITPTNNATWELKTVGSKNFWVIKDDYCGSDGVLDFKVKVVSNN